MSCGVVKGYELSLRLVLDGREHGEQYGTMFQMTTLFFHFEQTIWRLSLEYNIYALTSCMHSEP